MTEELKKIAESLFVRQSLKDHFASDSADADMLGLVERVSNEWPAFVDEARAVIASFADPTAELIEAYRAQLKSSFGLEEPIGDVKIHHFHNAIIEAALGEKLPKKAASDW